MKRSCASWPSEVSKVTDAANTLFPAGTRFLDAHRPGEDGYWHCTYTPDIPYATVDGVTLDLQLILPADPATRPPLVVYVQGSGWARQDTHSALPMLSALACRGFAVASVRFRDTSIAVFPAHLEDTKTAIRFLRSQAPRYGYQADRIGIWGTSSGGHTAALVGLTAGLFNTGDYVGFSDQVSAVADFYGPTDLPHMDDFPGAMQHNAPDSPESRLIGGPLAQHPDRAVAASPVTYVSSRPTLPPFLIIHGDSDSKVDFDQSARLYLALREAGQAAELYAVRGADHGDPAIAGPATISLLAGFFHKHLD
jgi:acetyl esterase/lipase